MARIDAHTVRMVAGQCGFELAGIAAAEPLPDGIWYQSWAQRGLAGEMRYLTGRRARIRLDPRELLSTSGSIICVGKLYNSSAPYSTKDSTPETGWISRYAWGKDYHFVLREGLRALVDALGVHARMRFDAKICVDTAPLLERSYARMAGLGWIGKNTCLIHQGKGSWFFLGAVLTSLEIEPDSPPADRCGTCTRCIDACPTSAIVPRAGMDGPRWELDARLCISYLTIELRGSIPLGLRPGIGRHVFGCDICQDVCPWNRKAPVETTSRFSPPSQPGGLEWMASLSNEGFGAAYASTPVWRARYRGFLRNVAVAMGNSGRKQFRTALERLAKHDEAEIAEHAHWALRKLEGPE